MCEFDGRFVLVELAFRGAVFRVVSIYAPNRNPDRDDFFVRCVNAVDPSVPTLLCGDFNTVFDRVVDRRGSCSFDVSCESSAMLSSLFSDCCVVDIWRELHPGVSAFSWCRPDGALAYRIVTKVFFIIAKQYMYYCTNNILNLSFPVLLLKVDSVYDIESRIGVNMCKKQKNFVVKMRRRGLINMQTKE